MNKLQNEIRTIVLCKIIVNARNGRMIERGKHVGLTFKILYNGLTHQRIRNTIDHFLHRHQLDDIWKMQVAGAIDTPHAANTNDILNDVSVPQLYPRLQLLAAWGLSIAP